ncbi:MAG: ABC transporter permease [Bacteroidaceae bacterium]|nr:ABC transporter permease [Bacteroidaceae bacterium]
MVDLFLEIWLSIRRNKMRTALTGVAVSWGIFMIIVLLGAGNGLMNAVGNNLSDVQTNTMMVGGGWTSKPYDGLQSGRRIVLDDHDVMTVAGPAFSANVDEVTATTSQSGTVSYRDNHFSGSLSGVYPSYCTMEGIRMVSGRFLNPNDLQESRKVAVISTRNVRNLFDTEDYEWCIGKRIRVGNVSFRVIGVYRVDDSNMSSDVYVPFTTLKTIFGKGKEIDELVFSFHGLSTEEDNEQFEKHLKAVINSAHRADPEDERALWIWNRFTDEMQLNNAVRILDIALWIIGLFTLMSGIVGVSNIMLVTVKERTHEFGIRKAIGASPRSIRRLIITESVLITAIFGYIGMILGMFACMYLDATVAEHAMEVMGEKLYMMKDPTVGMDVAMEATLLLIVAGTLAGLAPARRAAAVLPIEALRAD